MGPIEDCLPIIISSQAQDNDYQTAQKQTTGELTKATKRLELIPKLLKKIYEDNVGGKVSDEDYETLDRSYLLRRQKEAFGWRVLTDQKRYYAENCPGTVIERITMDEFIMMMLKGETL